MVDMEMRRRVRRLLDGDVHSEHFTRLFLHARSRCDGRDSVREIGDFVAHRDVRAKGVVTQGTRDFFHIIRFYIASWDHAGSEHFFASMPSFTPQFLRANLRTLTPNILKNKLRLDRKRVGVWIEGIIDRLHRNEDGTYCLKVIDEAEIERFEAFCGTLVIRPVFTAETLFRDFTTILRSQGLLEKREETAFQEFRTDTSLFAAASMHQCNISVDGDLQATLSAGLDQDRMIQVSVAVPSTRKDVLIGKAMFQTELGLEYCGEDLASLKNWNDTPIELSGRRLVGL